MTAEKQVRVWPRVVQRIAFALIWTAALATLMVLAFIVLYVLRLGLPHVDWRFLSRYPEAMGREGGILPAIVGTVVLTLAAVAVAAPLGIGAAVFLTEYTWESRVTRAVRFGAEALAGVPSIIYGLFGFIFFVTYLRMGWSILSGALTLAIMILPTIIRTAEEAILTVPRPYRDVSFGLGATRWQMVTSVVLPTALPGIVTGIILAIGRSVGETAAIIFTAGTALTMPTSLLSPARTMSVHFFVLAIEGISLEKAYATGAILILTTLLINVLANWLVVNAVRRHARRG
ncbi:MAG: phosphate ABC transporter permease PstA [Armatimonadetes bacterium]|nr:phosphate ABC transporter permease PstA [Armatimonadota bacterium]